MEKGHPLNNIEEVGFVEKMRERLDVHDHYTFQDFDRDWKLFKDGQLSTHDLYCKLVHAFYDEYHQDFLDDLKSFFIATTAPPPGQSCPVN